MKHTNTRSSSQRNNTGITLIEILLIIMLLSIFTAIYIHLSSNKMEMTKLDKTQCDILTIENGMRFYKLDNGFYPTTSQGIAALVTKPTTKPIPLHWTPYLKTIPHDKDGKPYHYENRQNDIFIDTYEGRKTYIERIITKCSHVIQSVAKDLLD